jgi:glycosyltransferase involved in cell wall biosynthesis
MKSVSIILPATDETYSLQETVQQARTVLATRDLQFVIVTSPTYTTADCRATIARLQKEFGNEIEAFEQTRPRLGGALQDAFERASGEYTVLMASDLETDPAALPAMIAALDGGADIAATSRWKAGAGFQGYPPAKLALNWLFQRFFRILYRTQLTDLTYGYRAYRTAILKCIRWDELNFPFLFECLVKPLRLGYKPVEIAVPWKARTEGRSHASIAEIVDYGRVGIRVRFMTTAAILAP